MTYGGEPEEEPGVVPLVLEAVLEAECALEHFLRESLLVEQVERELGVVVEQEEDHGEQDHLRPLRLDQLQVVQAQLQDLRHQVVDLPHVVLQQRAQQRSHLVDVAVVVPVLRYPVHLLDHLEQQHDQRVPQAVLLAQEVLASLLNVVLE